ncbi:MAG: hypothetical protein K0Q79_3545 [Flavipsychrobacter sp.]|nr:hypothetical protein [Flavipsychrobacter sp.]
MGFCCSMTLANAQETTVQRLLQDANHNVVATIRDGSVFNKDNAFIGQFKYENGAQTVYGSSRSPIGYILNENEVQDASRKTVGYIKVDRETRVMTFENAQHATVGRIKPGGIVENSSNVVIGYTRKVEPALAGTYYFLLKMN